MAANQMGVGIIVFDLGGGDAAYHFVNHERWDQIKALHAAVDDQATGWQDRLTEFVGYLTSDGNPEFQKPAGGPERKGGLLRSVYTQTYVLETLKVPGPILGILTFP